MVYIDDPAHPWGRPDALATVGRFAREQFSGALMSDTKWRKLLTAARSTRLGIGQMIVKFIDVEFPQAMLFPPRLACPRPYMLTVEFGAVELRAIEWLEFPRTARFERLNNLPARLQEQKIDELAQAIAGLGRFPLEVSAGALRVTGYQR